jgi:hypothetical protein
LGSSVATHLSDLVTVKIGPEKKTYSVHASFLTYHSEYFRAALNGSWKEAEDRVVTLEDVEPDAFEVFVDWLYTQQIPAELKEQLDNFATTDAAAKLLFGAYSLGDRVSTPAFCQMINNLTVDYYISGASAQWGTITDAFDILPPRCPILRALVDIHCWLWNPDDDDEGEKMELLLASPREFLGRAIRRYSEKAQNDSDWFLQGKLPLCDYHEHASDEERKKCKSECT